MEKQHILFLNALPDLFDTKKAREIGKKFNVPERSIARYITDPTFFQRIKRGLYKKNLPFTPIPESNKPEIKEAIAEIEFLIAKIKSLL